MKSYKAISLIFLLFYGVYVFADYVDKYPYGIIVKNIYLKDKNRQNLKIFQKNRLVYNYTNYGIDQIYKGDITGKGYNCIIYKGFSGGNHCCFDIAIVSIKPNMPKPFHLNLSNAEDISIVDLDNDKKPEIVFYDDQYSLIFGLCFACSPWVKVIADFDGKRLVLCAKLMKKLIKKVALKHQRIKVYLDNIGYIEVNYHKAFAKLFSKMLSLWYAGESLQAIRLMKNHLIFENRAVLKLFLNEIVNSMAESPFWNDIRRINGWKYQTACFTEGCMPPEELYEKFEVATKIFIAYEKL